MAGRTQKFSLNPRVNFWGDNRFSVAPTEPPHQKKLRLAKKLWRQLEWGTMPESNRVIYGLLNKGGYSYDKDDGWYKTPPTVEIITPFCSKCGKKLTGGLDTYGGIHNPVCWDCFGKK